MPDGPSTTSVSDDDDDDDGGGGGGGDDDDDDANNFITSKSRHLSCDVTLVGDCKCIVTFERFELFYGS